MPKILIDEEKNLTIVNAFYLGNNSLLLQFNNGEQKRLDFLPLFKQYAKGDYDIYIERGKFKRFKLESGNISWGK
ncbi:MAG: hypothetical protein ABIW38_11470, partial [Ferruginibacter sp.]